jgi:hypothetical protein
MHWDRYETYGWRTKQGKKKPAKQPGPAANLVHESLVKGGTVHGGPNMSVKFGMDGRCVCNRKTIFAASAVVVRVALFVRAGRLTCVHHGVPDGRRTNAGCCGTGVLCRDALPS